MSWLDRHLYPTPGMRGAEHRHRNEKEGGYSRVPLNAFVVCCHNILFIPAFLLNLHSSESTQLSWRHHALSFYIFRRFP